MIKFNLQWDQKFPKGSLEDITSGKCNATIKNLKIWDAIPGFWIDFLEHLTLSWNGIFMDSALKESASEIDKLEFELNHDLGRGIKGRLAPSILVYRYGNDFEVQVGEEKYKAPFNEMGYSLNSIGNEISARLRGSKDSRAKTAVEKWSKRKTYQRG